ncbi:hypothetical protein ANO11243_060720 [Dothideomycetidae sp. 11243]|nr:hypothetical protein ANO11243_060720 [fungal sp. No.11243]
MRKHLLLCFDAFGTLFRPRTPIHKQYGDTARKYGINGFTDEQLAQSFKNVSLTASQIIEKTFAPFLPGEDKKLPPVLAPALLHRFNSKEGYEMFSDATKLFKKFADTRPGQLYRRIDQHDDAKAMPEARLVLGLITNSDDRVPDVLSSFGLKVKPLRHGEDPRPYHPTNEPADIDFTMMSYDVGHEKPDSRIFDAASAMLSEMLAAEGHQDADLTKWRKVYVGDDLHKDALGAIDAGWEGVFLDRAEASPDAVQTSSEDSTLVEMRTVADGRQVPTIRDLAAVMKIIQ